MITIEGLIKFYTPYHYIGLLALLVAVYVYITKKKTFPLFIPFLFVNSFVEMYLVYYFGIKIKNSLVVYNYFIAEKRLGSNIHELHPHSALMHLLNEQTNTNHHNLYLFCY